MLSNEDRDSLAAVEDKPLPLVLCLWPGVKRIAPLDFPKYIPVYMTSYFHKFQTRWSIQLLRDWWCCQLVRGTHCPRGRHRDDPIPEFVYSALSWLLQRDVYSWPASGVRWKLTRLYTKLEKGENCVNVKNPNCLNSFS